MSAVSACPLLRLANFPSGLGGVLRQRRDEHPIRDQATVYLAAVGNRAQTKAKH
jgi:hypothetical protein